MGCDLSALSASGPLAGGGGDLVVPTKDGALDGRLEIDLVGAISMSSTAPTACQGATFTVYLEVTP